MTKNKENRLKTQFIQKMTALFNCLGAPSLSIATGPGQIVLSGLYRNTKALASLPGMLAHYFGTDFFPGSGLNAAQVFWSGPGGLYRIGPCRPEAPEWVISASFSGAFPPLFTIILEGEIAPGPWLYALGVSRLYRNGHLLDRGLEFEVDGIRGQIIHDMTVERLTLARPGELIETSQACCLVVQLQKSHEIPDLPAFLLQLAESMRTRFLKTDRDFSPDELSQAVDIDGLKQVVSRPQDLAALLGLGLQLNPKMKNPGDHWEVARYLLDPLVLPGFGPEACFDINLPVTVESLAPDWSRKAVPEIAEALPAKLARPSDALVVFLPEEIHAGPYSLPYLLLEPGCQITAGGEPFTAKRPLLLLARQGRKARAIVGDLLKREWLLTYLVSLSGQRAELARRQVILDRHGLKIDPLLAAIWLVSQAAGLRRGEASSLGRLRQHALAVSLAMLDEIEAVHRRILRTKKPDPTAAQALSQAVQALTDRRQKLLARLEKEARKTTS
jgi:hypothetical protein